MNIHRILTTCIVLFLFVAAARTQQYSLLKSVVSSGGSEGSSSTYFQTNTVGQSVIGQDGALAFTSVHGFWPAEGTWILTLSHSLLSGWNLMSVPVVVNDFRKTTLYPGAVSPAFIYQGSYQHRDSLANGVGFWLKFGTAGNAVITGSLIQKESVAVASGWNIIGTPSYPALVSNIVPSGTTVISNYFGYSSSYFLEDTLEPGFGYWVRVSSAGTLILNSGSAMNLPSSSRTTKTSAVNQKMKISSQLSSLGDVNIITLTDAQKKTATLYFLTTSNVIDPSTFDLPPQAPPGSPDVRFGTNRLVEFADRHRPKTIPITVQGMEYPLTLGWNLTSTSLPATILIDGKRVVMEGQGNTRVRNLVSTLGLQPSEGTELPKDFAVNQNYPNPFNPTTVIKYELPIASRVTLMIYNVLGQVVAELANGIETAGYKSIEWNATNLASGIYFYRLYATGVSAQQVESSTSGGEATSEVNPGKTFTQVKKMLLIK